MAYRPERLAEAIKEEVAALLQNELKDPRLGFVSVTDVEVSSDLRHARVYVSVLGSEEECRESLKVLSRASGFVRSTIGRRIKLRHTPEITFVYDPSIARGARIMQLLTQIHREEAGKQEEADKQTAVEVREENTDKRSPDNGPYEGGRNYD